MKIIYLSLFFFCLSLPIRAQNEANIWYFGYNAGLDFNSGSPQVLMDGQLHTNEGCATISDNEGKLLFYTDGITVYSKDHSIMENGSGLKGNSSSTHSAIIIPKPGSPNIHYIFTVDALTLNGGGPNGLQYSEVDMSLNGALGRVTKKNNLLHTPVNEKVTAVRKPDSEEYWVVAHKYDSYEFITYDVTASGVNTTAIVSSVGETRSTRTTGQIKISPDGSKLAVAWTGKNAELFNFNINTGKVGSLITPLNPPGNPYGIEFSPNSNLLYCSYYPGVSQYDLLAGTPGDIANSGVILQSGTSEPYSSLQIGPDGKIYVAKSDRLFIDVIDNPNSKGIACNYRYKEIYLNERRSGLGLPTFISSFFHIEGIVFENTCFGDTTKFSLSDTVDSVVWNFGDPSSGVNNTSTALDPTHVFSGPGNYEVSVVATIGSETANETINVTIMELPAVNTMVELKQCDDDLDGFTDFNLNEVIPKITSNSAKENIEFYESIEDAENDQDPILNNSVYKNQVVSEDNVWVRVENENGCYKISRVKLVSVATQIPDSYSKDFYACDINEDGISEFDFSSVQAEIEAMFPAGQHPLIKYYRNEANALAEENPITNISSYQNIGFPATQQIYIRVDGEQNNDCLGLGAHINLNVVNEPVANSVNVSKECDDDHDGKFPFDVSHIQSTILGDQSSEDFKISYLDENNNTLPSPLPNPFLTSSQLVTARVKNKNVGDESCYAETIIEFTVSRQPIANQVEKQISCDDGDNDSDGIHEFETSQIESSILDGQLGMEVHYYSETGSELPSPLPNPFSSSTQTIRAEVINPENRSCSAVTQIEFIVNKLPDFEIESPQIVCSSDPTFSVILDPIEGNPSEMFDYQWIYEDGTFLSNAPTLSVSTPGTYSVTLTKTDGTGCSRTNEIFVNASELATITHNDITIIDNSDRNSIGINNLDLGQGDYEFSLDSELSNYQDNPLFENVNPGIHQLYVRDKKGCGTTYINVSVIGYPRFFTPNGDGYNDFWQLKGVNDQFQTNSEIFIFDRYGKLLRQMSAVSIGWNGTLNGKLLPADDYWFSVTLEDGRTFKGHFSLIR